MISKGNWMLGVFTLMLLILEFSNCSPFNKYEQYYKRRGNAAAKNVNIETECGQVEGKSFAETTHSGKSSQIYEFRNIPYAVPPVGSLRFRPPVRLSEDPTKCWNGTLRYDEKKIVACKQDSPREPNLVSSEDCLVLTIRTPTLRKNAKLPVIFWIHGGAMVWGHSQAPDYYPNREFTVSMNAVTVSINYRLNGLGFLSLQELWINSGPDESYGNYGIMDQILALKWVRDNIQNFGGDPKEVTIFGESGGATAVYGLIASPLAKELFKKASPLSGVPNYRVTHTQANQILRPFIELTPCGQLTDKDNIVACLQKLPAEVFVGTTDIGPEQTTSSVLSYHWIFQHNAPYVGFSLEILDPVVVPYSPDHIPTTRGDSIDLLIGNSAEEVSVQPISAAYFERNITDFASLENEVKPRLDSFKNGTYPLMLSLYTEGCGRRLMSGRSDAQHVYNTMSTDALVTCTTNSVAKHLAKLPKNSVYRYVISQPDSKELGFNIETAYHGWGTDLLFGLTKVARSKIPRTDRKLMFNIRRVYKKFIHSDSWFQYRYKNRVIEFARNSIICRRGYHEPQCTAWEYTGVLTHSWGNLGR